MPTKKQTIQQWTASAMKTAAKRGRPVTTGTTPAKDRKAKERATATEQGGGRLNINLTPLAAGDLAALQARWPSMTKTQIVNSALHAYRRGL